MRWDRLYRYLRSSLVVVLLVLRYVLTFVQLLFLIPPAWPVWAHGLVAIVGTVILAILGVVQNWKLFFGFLLTCVVGGVLAGVFALSWVGRLVIVAVVGLVATLIYYGYRWFMSAREAEQEVQP
jgi:hypothetical protein